MKKRYFKLGYSTHLSEGGRPILEVDSVPVLRQLHDEINFIIMNPEYFDEIVGSLKDVLDGKLRGYSFGYEVYSFSCDKEECDVYEWLRKKLGVFRTIDMYEMLRYFQHYRDDYYSRMNS